MSRTLQAYREMKHSLRMCWYTLATVTKKRIRTWLTLWMAARIGLSTKATRLWESQMRRTSETPRSYGMSLKRNGWCQWVSPKLRRCCFTKARILSSGKSLASLRLLRKTHPFGNVQTLSIWLRKDLVNPNGYSLSMWILEAIRLDQALSTL